MRPHRPYHSLRLRRTTKPLSLPPPFHLAQPLTASCDNAQLPFPASLAPPEPPRRHSSFVRVAPGRARRSWLWSPFLSSSFHAFIHPTVALIRSTLLQRVRALSPASSFPFLLPSRSLSLSLSLSLSVTLTPFLFGLRLPFGSTLPRVPFTALSYAALSRSSSSTGARCRNHRRNDFDGNFHPGESSIVGSIPHPIT
ncbi:hypothetical protein BJV74DRAFT_870875 [Russula compacta]|nr:hypothetical protein BJV74DRAFT_870875 [Russula compacta]